MGHDMNRRSSCIFLIFIFFTFWLYASDAATFEFYAHKLSPSESGGSYMVYYENLYDPDDTVVADGKVFQTEYEDFTHQTPVPLFRVVFESNYIQSVNIGLSIGAFSEMINGEYDSENSRVLPTYLKYDKKLEHTSSSDDYFFADGAFEIEGESEKTISSFNAGPRSFDVRFNEFEGQKLNGTMQFSVSVSAYIEEFIEEDNLNTYRMPIRVVVQGS